jgi:DNA-binding beta-propeller fold protein YncE
MKLKYYLLVAFFTHSFLMCAKVPTSTENQAPVLQGITSTSSTHNPSQSYWFHAEAVDPDLDSLTWSWSANLGEILISRGDSTLWMAPDSSAYIRLTCEVQDNSLATDADTLRFWIDNLKPVIIEMQCDHESARFGTTVHVSASVADPDSQDLELSWSTPLGVLQPDGEFGTSWTVPDTTYDAWIELLLTDAEGATTRDSLWLPVYEETGCVWVVNEGTDQIVKLSSIGSELLRIDNLAATRDLTIDAENRRLWVLHGESELSSFDLDGTLLTNQAGLANPTHLACWERTGQVWVLESDSTRLVAFSMDGFGPERLIDGFRRPNALDIHQANGTLWVCDEGEGAVYEILGDLEVDIFDPDTTEFAQGHYGFIFPAAVAVEDSTGAAWVADREAGRLTRYESFSMDSIYISDLQEVALVSTPGGEGLCWTLERGAEPGLFRTFYEMTQTEISDFSDPRGLAASPETGHVWVSDSGRNSILLYDASGNLLLRKQGFDMPGLLIVHRGF